MKFKAIVLCILLALLLALPSPSFTQMRNPKKVYKVAILPFMIHSQENLDYLQAGIYDILTSRITVEGRIVVIERSLVEQALYEEKPTRLDETAASKIGTKVGADYVVLGSITKVGDYISLDARLISLTEEKPPLTAFTQHKGIEDVMVKIGDFAQDIGNKILGRRAMTGRPGERREGRAIERLGQGDIDYKKSQTFGFEIKGLDIGDVDGDGKNELVVMDSNNLYIFKYDGEKLSLFQKIAAGSENNFLTLDVADLNRSGHAQIIVSSVVEDDVRSFIFQYEEGKFKKVTEKAGWFFRVLDHPKEGPILLGQQRGADGLPVSPTYRMVWKKKSFEKGPKMNFPSETTIFGLAMADIRGKGKPEIIALDNLDCLNISSEDGKNHWRSKDRFGGTNNFYETLKTTDIAFRPGGAGQPGDAPSTLVNIRGRILVKDLFGEGVPQIIINKNEFLTGNLSERVKIYDKAEIRGLVWGEDGLATDWKTREIKGYIADFQFKDVANDGNEELVVAVVAPPDTEGEGITTFLSKKSRSNIYFFKLY
jgi:TolB-like protein